LDRLAIKPFIPLKRSKWFYLLSHQLLLRELTLAFEKIGSYIREGRGPEIAVNLIKVRAQIDT
jgi:hypothetical protein